MCLNIYIYGFAYMNKLVSRSLHTLYWNWRCCYCCFCVRVQSREASTTSNNRTKPRRPGAAVIYTEVTPTMTQKTSRSKPSTSAASNQVFILVSISYRYFVCGSVAQWLGRWTCDWCAVNCDFRQVVHTHLPLLPSTIIWYWRKLG